MYVASEDDEDEGGGKRCSAQGILLRESYTAKPASFGTRVRSSSRDAGIWDTPGSIRKNRFERGLSLAEMVFPFESTDDARSVFQVDKLSIVSKRILSCGCLGNNCPQPVGWGQASVMASLSPFPKQILHFFFKHL